MRVTTYKAREIAFGGGKTYLIDNGRRNVPGQLTDQAVVEQTAAGPRTITTAAVLSSGAAFTGQFQSVPIPLQLSLLGAAADGAFLSARISPAPGLPPAIVTFARSRDASPVFCRMTGSASFTAPTSC